MQSSWPAVVIASAAAVRENKGLGGRIVKRAESSQSTEHKIKEFAEDLGKLLGHAQTKAEGWLSQRQQIVKHLEAVRDTATRLLSRSEPGRKRLRAEHEVAMHTRSLT